MKVEFAINIRTLEDAREAAEALQGALGGVTLTGPCIRQYRCMAPPQRGGPVDFSRLDPEAMCPACKVAWLSSRLARELELAQKHDLFNLTPAISHPSKT